MDPTKAEDAPLIELWLKKHWSLHFKSKKSVKEIDQEMQNLVRYLLQLGEDLDPEKIKINYTKEELLVHMEEINAIMVTIKPGFFSIFTSRYTYKMLLKYLLAVKGRTPQDLKKVPLKTSLVIDGMELDVAESFSRHLPSKLGGTP